MLSRVQFLLVLLVLSGCGQSATARDAESPTAAPALQPPPQAAPEPGAEAMAASDADMAAEAAPAPSPRAVAPGAPEQAGATVPLATSGASGVVQAMPNAASGARARMLDIEAHLTLQVPSVTRAAAELRRLTLASDGDVVEESIQDTSSSARGQLTLRVPTQAAEDVLRKVEAVGSVISRQVTARDVGKQYYDATLRLANLGWSLARFEQILARANSVDEILRVEQEISRVRGQIEQIKGELRYLTDRTARATIHVSLLGPEVVVEPPVVTVQPEAKFHPGLRLTYLGDFWGAGGNATYAGGGVSLRLSRHFSVDIDGLRSSTGDAPGPDLFLATAGGELYSDFLGGGQRKWLNPYLGFRAGYARRLGKNEIAAGGGFGVEIFKTDFLTIDLDARFYGLFGSAEGAHLAVQPALGANVAF
ncbi:MAG TPA: DUF4349 domain-containing protein [Polyangiaceae bacterium]|nr:DUF4349 domain-containing protein [Polyangiaceae bacterium]